MADSENKVQDFLNDFNEAMAIHAQNAVKGLSFDKSELGKIVDITNRDRGEYQVFNGSVRYYAYSDNHSYTLGTKVWVTIPNNDYSQQKQITGKYKTGDENTDLEYHSPLEQYQPLTKNLLEVEEKSSEPYILSYNGKSQSIPVQTNYNNTNGTSLLANFNRETQSPGAQYTLLYHVKDLDETSEFNKGYKYMGLSAKFKVPLNGCFKGDYGLLVVVTYYKKTEVTKEQQLIKKLCKVDTTSMVGNVYNFNTYYKQDALYELDNDGVIITDIAILFYQDGNFVTSDGVFPYSSKLTGLYEDNIFVKDIVVQFGDEIPPEVKDVATIYTLNGLSYDSAETNDKLNEKRISLRWKHKIDKKTVNDDGTTTDDWEEYTSNNSRLAPKVHWYTDAQFDFAEYRAQTAKESAETDTLLELIDKWKNHQDKMTDDDYKDLIREANLNPKTDYTRNWDGAKFTGYRITSDGQKALDRITTRNGKKTNLVSNNLAGNNWIPLEGEGNELTKPYIIKNIGDTDFSIDYQPDNQRQTSSVKCIIEYTDSDGENVIVESNIITFTNASWVADPETQAKALGVTLTTDDKSNGNYPLYNGSDGRILQRYDTTKKRTLIADLKSIYTKQSALNGNETILWSIPINNTMINFNGTVSSSNFTEISAQNYEQTEIYNKKLSEFLANDAIDFNNNKLIMRQVDNGTPIDATLSYYVKEYYLKGATNNTIFCWIIKNNSVYKGNITFAFSQHGSCGTDYTFTLGLGELVDQNFNVVGPAAPALTLGEKNYRKIKFSLIDANGEEIQLSQEKISDIIKAWAGNDEQRKKGYYSGLNNSKNLDFIINNNEIAVRCNTNNIIDYRYIILQASIIVDEVTSTYTDPKDPYKLYNVNFTQLLPLHVRLSDNYNMNGADYITYNDNGASPQSYSTSYDITGVSGESFRIIRDDKEISNTSNQASDTTNDDRYYPHLDGNNKIVPCPIYVENISKQVEIEAHNGDTIYYIAPIAILINRYQIPAVNSWNGKMLLDDKGNRLMAATIGAGTKDTKNRFTGVLMGSIKQDKGGTSNGLFGYHEGEQSYGWKSDGTGFIGKSGTGRIEFNGNKGTIQSASYRLSDNHNNGMLIDLDDGYIDIRGDGRTYHWDNNSRSYVLDQNTDISQDTDIRIDASGRQGSYFKIQVPNENQRSYTSKLIDIGKNNYYLQTADYEHSNNKGLKIDLKNGRFDSRGVLTINGAAGSSINFGNGKLVLHSSDNDASFTSSGSIHITGDSNSSINFGNGTFSVSGNGHLNATDATIQGSISASTITGTNISGGTITGTTITNGSTFYVDAAGNLTATSGFIGGWSIGQDRLSALNGSVYLDSSNGYIHGAYFDGGTIHANRIDADSSMFLSNKRLAWSHIEYMTSVAAITIGGSFVKVATNVQSTGTGLKITYDKIYIPSIIHMYYDTATAYILGNENGSKHDSMSNDLGSTVISGGTDTVQLSGFASSSHKHSFSGSGTATVNGMNGTASVSGTTGSAF